MLDTERGVHITITLDELAVSYGMSLEVLKERTRHLVPWEPPGRGAPRYRTYDLELVFQMPIERIEVYSAPLAAVVLGVTPQHVNHLISNGKIANAIRAGRRTFIPRASLDAELIWRIRGGHLLQARATGSRKLA